MESLLLLSLAVFSVAGVAAFADSDNDGNGENSTGDDEDLSHSEMDLTSLWLRDYIDDPEGFSGSVTFASSDTGDGVSISDFRQPDETYEALTEFGGLWGYHHGIGSNFDETIRGTALNDHFIARYGSDIIHGLAGDDTIDIRGLGADTAYAGSGSDRILLHNLDLQDVTFGPGEEIEFGSDGSLKTVFGGSGDDLIIAESPGFEIFSGAGADRVALDFSMIESHFVGEFNPEASIVSDFDGASGDRVEIALPRAHLADAEPVEIEMRAHQGGTIVSALDMDLIFLRGAAPEDVDSYAVIVDAGPSNGIGISLHDR